MELSTPSLIIICVLTFLLVFVILPAFFNNLKKLWYLKHNKTTYTESFFYDAEKGEILSTRTPIH